MSKLYFICPTDSLEPIINDTFTSGSYYYTSLGNSITFDKHVMRQIKKLIRTKKIQEIYFVLSNDNRILLDALGNQNFSDITGLNDFYTQIIQQKKDSETSWQGQNHQSLILSNHLNNKIKELKLELSGSMADRLKIGGKIYHKKENIFSDTYHNLIAMECFSLN